VISYSCKPSFLVRFTHITGSLEEISTHFTTEIASEPTIKVFFYSVTLSVLRVFVLDGAKMVAAATEYNHKNPRPE
jgi:hypothetical protein